jgi:Recombinase
LLVVEGFVASAEIDKALLQLLNAAAAADGLIVDLNSGVVALFGVKAIARDLNRRGVPTILEGGKGKWNHSVITRMLMNPTYMGANVFNRRTMRLGKLHVRRFLRERNRSFAARTAIKTGQFPRLARKSFWH